MELTQRSPVRRVKNHGIETLNNRRSLCNLNASFYRCLQDFQLSKSVIKETCNISIINDFHNTFKLTSSSLAKA